MSTPSLRTRIRNISLTLVILVIGLGLYALPRVYRLGTATRVTPIALMVFSFFRL